MCQSVEVCVSPDRRGKPLKPAGTGKRPTIGQYLPSSDDHHEPVYFQRADRAVSTLMISHVLGVVEALGVELDGFARPTAVYLQRKTICGFRAYSGEHDRYQRRGRRPGSRRCAP